MGVVDEVAGVSGAALGVIAGLPDFLGGSVGGAYYGYKAGKSLSQKSRSVYEDVRSGFRSKDGKIGISGGKTLPKKMAMAEKRKRKSARVEKKSGDKRKMKSKSASKPKKKVKTSAARKSTAVARRVNKRARNFVKGIVENALSCEIPEGTYKKMVAGDMKWENTTANYQMVWGGCKRDNGNAGIYTAQAMAFEPFHMFKLLDAASVLYNGKTANVNYEAVANNFDKKGMKLEVIHASYDLILKNNAMYPYTVIIHEGVSKEDQSDSLNTLWTKSLNNVQWVGSVPNINTYGLGIKFPEITKKFDVRSETISLLPGQSHRIYREFHGCVNFDKHSDNGTLQSFGKGVSRCFSIVVRPNLVAVNPSGGANWRGTLGITDNNNGNSKTISVLMKEVYKLRMPDQTVDGKADDVYCHFLDIPDGASLGVGSTLYEKYRDEKNEYTIS